MVTHYSYTWGDDLIRELRDELVARRRILPPYSGAMCMLQVRGQLVFWLECRLAVGAAWTLRPACLPQYSVRAHTSALLLNGPTNGPSPPAAKPGGGRGGEADG